MINQTPSKLKPGRDEFVSSKKELIYRGFCGSIKCVGARPNGAHLTKLKEIPDIKKFQMWCPECGCALLWRKA